MSSNILIRLLCDLEIMENTAVYIVFILNCFCMSTLAIIFRNRVVNQKHSEIAAKHTFTMIALPLGVVFSLGGYYMISLIYMVLNLEPEHGHAEESLIFIFSLIVNIFLTAVAVIIGRVLIGWKTVQW